MADPLAGIRAKQQRALDHLDTLKVEWRAYVDTEPYEIASKYKAKRCKFSFNVASLSDNPPRFGVLVGDFVHEMRSALDHLVYQLARNATKRLRGTYYPVCGSRDEFEVAARRALAGVPPPAIDVIEHTQPYNTPGQSAGPVGTLNALWNADKHRVIVTTAGWIDLDNPRLTGEPRPSDIARFVPQAVRDVERIVEWGILGRGRLEQGAQVAWATILPSGPNPEMSMDPYLPLVITLSDDPAVEVLEALFEFVDLLVRGLGQAVRVP